MSPPPSAPTRADALLIRRLLALFYDVWPVVALWLLASALFTVGYTLAGHGARENIAPFSPLQWLLWGCCWVLAGLYATISWRRGGQTLGMRPWRLHLRTLSGQPPTWAALWRRYAVATLSLLCGGLGFWWALLDRQQLTVHDRLSGTRLVRIDDREI
ncbi:RDD family protein [Stenotrophomonas sp. YIM B06876]|uniref:RDD family protein n=1 Tax=Stenotrophomonas sp. YIM B06876 TaxID=3060211 RepID=UPI002739AAEB|nr:RDD family protein [Stenotrophomonas sp. YIM B06876]